MSTLTVSQRTELAQQLSQQTGFKRVRLQGIDASGNRVRVEFRADKGLVKNEVQGMRDLANGGGRNGPISERDGMDQDTGQVDQQTGRPDDQGSPRAGSDDGGRPDRADGQRERVEIARPEHGDLQRPERPDRSGGSGRH